MFLFPARMKKIQSKMKALECSQHFSHCKSIGNFSGTQGQLTAVHGPIRLNLELNPDFLWLSLLPAKMKKIQSKMKELVFTTLYIDFSDAQVQLTP